MRLQILFVCFKKYQQRAVPCVGFYLPAVQMVALEAPSKQALNAYETSIETSLIIIFVELARHIELLPWEVYQMQLKRHVKRLNCPCLFSFLTMYFHGPMDPEHHLLNPSSNTTSIAWTPYQAVHAWCLFFS
jgi:hypothetical protein